MTVTSTRTGDDLTAAVIEELRWAVGVDAAQIDVAVAGGVVTLTGEVDTYPERLRAGQAAQRVRGVIGLAQEITVRGSWDAVTDADIARHGGEALHRAVNVPDAVKIAVHDHVVTLSGVVEWQYQRQAAAHTVQYAPGVTSVLNLIEVRPAAVPEGVRDAVEAALVRNAEIEASRVTVTVEGDVVTLAGTVLSWAERRQVEDACWAAPGVAVDPDDLRIEY